MPVNYDEEIRLAYLRAALNMIRAEEKNIATYREFYAGEQGIKLTDRQEEYITTNPESYANICERVVAVPSNRLNIPEDGIMPIDESSRAYADTATNWWSDISEADEAGDYDLCSMQSDLYDAGLRDGSVGMVVGWDSDLQRPTFDTNLIYDGESGLVRFHYDSNNRLMFASRRWVAWNPLEPGVTGEGRLNIYAPGYIARHRAAPHTAYGWQLIDGSELDVPNPMPWTDTGTFEGKPLGVAVIPFTNPPGSELRDVLAIQEMLNHNLGTYDIVIDLHSFPAIWFQGARFPVDSATGLAEIPSYGPGQAYNLPKDATMNRLEAADLKNLFEGGILSWADIISLIKGWPPYLLNRTSQPPSGYALSIMEAPLVKQVLRKQKSHTGSWRSTFNLARKLHRLHTGEELPGQITFSWDPAGTPDPLRDMEVLEKKFETGDVPRAQRLRELGYSQDEIDKMLSEEAQAPERQLTQLALTRERSLMEIEE